MSDDGQVVFYIDAYSPKTIPMAKLAEYLGDFAELLGKEHAVHFARLESGSTKIVADVGHEDLPKVTARLSTIRHGDAPRDLNRLVQRIDRRLANDNAAGRVVLRNDTMEGMGELLVFPGRNRQKLPSYGPFNQEGHLDGVLISVGGRDETISVQLQNGEVRYTHCETSRTIARELGKHMFEPIRIYGSGRWLREAEGEWTLVRFRIHRFDVLGSDSLQETVAALRAVPGSGWRDIDDPLGELEKSRRDH
jgi:hypothetical protein